MKFKAIEDPYVTVSKMIKACNEFQVTGENALEIINSDEVLVGNGLPLANLYAKMTPSKVPLWLLIECAQSWGLSVKLPKTENELGSFGKKGEYPYYDLSEIEDGFKLGTTEAEAQKIIELLGEFSYPPISKGSWISDGEFITECDFLLNFCRKMTHLPVARQIIETAR